MRKFIFLIFFFQGYIFQLSIHAQSVDGNVFFEEANTYFSQKKYEEAILQYQLLLDNGFESAEVFFNLGTCYSLQKKWGKAILNFERALLLDPNDATILHNLQIANLETVDEIEKIPTFFLARWWASIRNLASSGVWAILGILLLWIGIAGMMLWILGKERTKRKKGFLLGWGSIALSLIVFALAYSSYKVQMNSGAAIIMKREAALKALPDEISSEILLLHEGTKVEITEKITSWYKVRLENGEVGWILESNLEEI